MNVSAFASLEECFGDLPDPRVQGLCDHLLVDILLIAIGAVLCGAASWSEVEAFGHATWHPLARYL